MPITNFSFFAIRAQLPLGESWADVITAAAGSPLGVLALMCLIVGALATFLLKGSSPNVRAAAFFILVVGVGLFAYVVISADAATPAPDDHVAETNVLPVDMTRTIRAADSDGVGEVTSGGRPVAGPSEVSDTATIPKQLRSSVMSRESVIIWGRQIGEALPLILTDAKAGFRDLAGPLDENLADSLEVEPYRAHVATRWPQLCTVFFGPQSSLDCRIADQAPSWHHALIDGVLSAVQRHFGATLPNSSFVDGERSYWCVTDGTTIYLRANPRFGSVSIIRGRTYDPSDPPPSCGSVPGS